ncbi:hypothetical protein EDB92DRAFT_1815825 [Lactarius akahatsu]|uniref:Uncharacterized protein n=1 Tax=Lactarius akahatsu TaxID=416441 RepID=A0AAD4LLE5_9AGAM|nr:hypothetical protein EDB92DRAFT_1815825 [Lactarius akahatsu]
MSVLTPRARALSFFLPLVAWIGRQPFWTHHKNDEHAFRDPTRGVKFPISNTDASYGREIRPLECLCQQTGNEDVSTCSRIIPARSAKELRPGHNRRRARKYEYRPARTVGFT